MYFGFPVKDLGDDALRVVVAKKDRLPKRQLFPYLLVSSYNIFFIFAYISTTNEGHTLRWSDGTAGEGALVPAW